MNVGEFRERLTLLKRVSKMDAAGNCVTWWQPHAEVYAKAKAVSGREFYEAAAHQMEDVVTFYLRWRTDLTNDMRIDFRGEQYDILYINPLGYKQDFMAIKARLARGEVHGGGENRV